MAVKLDLQEIRTYGYCPLMYDLRYRQKFPWFAPTYETAMAQTVRDATTFMVAGYMQPPSARVVAQKTARLMLARGHKLALEIQRRGRVGAPPTSTLAEAEYGLRALEDHGIQPIRDRVLGVNVPYTVKVDEDLSVAGSIDAVYEYMWESPAPVKVFMAQTNVADPLDDSVKWGSLSRGFALRTIDDGSRYMRHVRFLEFQTLAGELPVRFQAPTLTDAEDFDKLARNVAKLIASGGKVPTQHPQKCTHCPYNSVCSVSLVDGSKPVIDSAREKVEELARKSKFRSNS